jgi:outer membrane immunogenic protein
MRAFGIGVALAFVASCAVAADLHTPPPLAPPAPSWTAVYVGLHAGGLWGNTDWQFASAGAFNPSPLQTQTSGFLGGGQIGVNYQLPGLPLVVGVEGEISAASTSGGTFLSSSPRMITSAAGRVGFISNATTLLFIKAGPAWLRTDYEHTNFYSNLTPASTFTPSVTNTKLGVLAGAGAEFLITPNWSAKVEYNYLDFGSSLVNFGNPFPPFPVSEIYTARQRDHVVKVGVNYLFGPR